MSNVKRNSPKQIISESTKELPMKVANTYVTKALRNAQEAIIWNRTNKLPMKVDNIYVTNVIRSSYIQIS